MLEQLIFNFGYLGLFLSAFLSSTLIPLSSEALVVLMMKQLNYSFWLFILIASIGNYFGALTNYYIGKGGKHFFMKKHIKYSEKIKDKAEKYYNKWGAPTLFFSWLPIIGDPLCIFPGMFNLDLKTFTIWVFAGKLFRYLVLMGIINWIF